MKKKYVRPVIELENFELTQQIASCSAVKINLTDSACVLDSPYASEEMRRLALAGFFVDKCDMLAIGMDDTDGICYMTSVNLAFSS